MKFKEAVAPGSILTWLVIKRLVRQHSIKGTFLDVGCGEGYLTGQLLSIGLSGVAVEPSQRALQRMSQRLIGPKREREYSLSMELWNQTLRRPTSTWAARSWSLNTSPKMLNS